MRTACGAVLTLVLLPLMAAAHEPRAARAARLGDASLHAVQFIDKDIGWAVGDEGVLLGTIDGGKTWERKPTGLEASLRSVHFRSPFVGWVAGREELPGGASVGVLLYTRDGGETWQQLLPSALPGLNQVRFVDDATGFLLADGSDIYPTGLFRTRDGGRSWEPVPGPRTTAWLAGDFQDDNTGVLGGAWSRLATLKEGQLQTAADLRTLTGRHVHALQVLPRRLLAAAEGGLVLTSGSAGASWGFADTKLTVDALACLDFRSMHAVGDCAWVVGRPGSVVLHSRDGGTTWQLCKTGQPLPLHGVFFFDEQRGWAVGAAGTILATTDGGQTWQVQRQGGKRVAALLVHAHAAGVPVDTLAVLGASEGYLTAALRVVAPDPASASPWCAREGERLSAAVRQAGGMSAEALWAFPQPQYLDEAERKQVFAHWDKIHGGAAERELLRQLVLALRVWRPSAVLGDAPDSKDAAAGLVADALQEALRLAPDNAAFPEQIEVLGLSPWQASRSYAIAAAADGAVVQDNHEPLTVLAGTAAEHAGWPALLLAGDINRLPTRRGYRLLHNHPPGSVEQSHWMVGLAIEEGDARRPRAWEKDDQPAAADLLKAIRERRNLVALAAQPDDHGHALTRVGGMLRRAQDELSADRTAAAAFAVASQYAQRGQWQLAEQAYTLLVEHYPAHRLSAEAYRWLIRHAVSGEARQRRDLKQFAHVTAVRGQAPGDAAPAPVQQVVGTRPVDDKAQSGLKVLEYSLKNSNAAPAAAGDAQTPLDLGKRLAGFGPLYAADPAAQFCLQALRRQQGNSGAAQDWFERFHKYVGAGPWAEAARGELWLSQRAAAPRRVARCRLTEQRPYLDGNFNDSCWEGQAPLRLVDAAGETASAYVSEAMFAYDQEFLYVALRCQHPEGHHVAPVQGRSHDAVLETHDRVSLILDLDRDRATYYRLEIDQRGCVRDESCGDRSWNPRWFVAVNSGVEHWHIEAAIPLSELSAERIALGSAWAFNVVRILPSRGVQAWSLPADVRPRSEGFGLLLFQQDSGARPMPVER